MNITNLNYNHKLARFLKVKSLIKLSFLIIIILELQSCGPVAEIFYGVHEPRLLSDDAVLNYAEKLDINGDIYRLKEYSNTNKKKYRYLGNTLPDMLLYNSKGELVKFNVDCTSDLATLANLKVNTIDTMATQGFDLRGFLENSYPINKVRNFNMESINRPIYVIKFGEYAGKINKRHVPDLIEEIRNRQDVIYILLNMDYTL